MFSLFLLAAFGLIISKLLINCWNLRTIPGPFLAGISDFWRTWYQYRGQLRGKLIALHKQHGPLVRYSPNCVSISDPSAISIIYGSRAGFITAESYKVLLGISNGHEVESLVSTSDEAKHAALRRSINKAFTPTTVLEYEPCIDLTISDLLETLGRHKSVDLSSILLFSSMDAAYRVAFTENLGCLQSESDVGGIIRIIRDRFIYWGFWSTVPWLERLIFRNPIAMNMKRTPSPLLARAMKIYQTRKDISADETHADILGKLILASNEVPEVLDTTAIIGLLISLLSGAGDTTATTTTILFFYLLKNKRCLEKLTEEIKEAHLSTPPSFAQVSKLPYLNAVIKETMRLFAILTFPMERKVPTGGVTIAGRFFTEETTIGCNISAVHLDKMVFGDDADVFRPERWIEAGEEEGRRMEAASIGFSRGRRVCLGQHIAVMQMKKVVASLIMGFKFKLEDPHAELEADFAPAVVALKPLYVRVEKVPV